MSNRKRYSIVDTGGRADVCRGVGGQVPGKQLTRRALRPQPSAHGWHNRQIRESFDVDSILTYHGDDFDRMVKEKKPDRIIVTTADFMHHHYIVRAMELVCDAISENPMTIVGDKANEIFDATERTGKKLRVTFNRRHQPQITQVC